VPVSFWHGLFFTGHGWGTSIENAVVGPFVAIISFVCSVGNVPLAAALWHGGISFGGVVAFIFADLIAFPLLLIYRRYYGTRVMLRLLGIFWLVMSAAGLITQVIFRAAGIVPSVRPAAIAPATFSWNYTTYLNIAFLAAFGLLYWAYRNRDRLGGGTGYAIDPVCGMQVETAHAPASAMHDGQRSYFCSDHCAARFAAKVRGADTRQAPPAHASAHTGEVDRHHEYLAERADSQGDQRTDPVCGMTISISHGTMTASSNGTQYWFCGPGCAQAFAAQSAQHLFSDEAPLT